ncbi:SAM-dependent methyltransferase [Ralstonia solanacearum]|uniref:SAM-dependent methyltransferase n=1 Tax=Ralstonia solanacearum TaxID=305 RepID=A0AAD0SAW8_RALSL|nr:SAM-dependent methyltransferase [Ralstonia solanacearum]AXV82615.1 SAM-dependent methyltransferase [Ralstonia solanacearum]AXW53736.1 SAM-dependent methyltransferase [Ralstonia solanacearum]CBJ52270.1 putative Thiopurine S-methyltransferase [Ralstonia solanacearum PSI07]
MAQPPVFTTRDAADPAFWDERFSRDHTPWDAHGVPAAFRQFCEAQPAPLSTLIPGCGNAYEAGWLAGRGWPVTAIDFAPSAVASAQAVLGPHAGVVELADFFRFVPRRPVQWIYERAFLCAMPRRLWADYAEQVARLLSPGALLAGFFVVAAGQEASPTGPPFEITAAELEALLSPALERLADVPIADVDSLPVFAGRERWQVWRRREISV